MSKYDDYITTRQWAEAVRDGTIDNATPEHKAVARTLYRYLNAPTMADLDHEERVERIGCKCTFTSPNEGPGTGVIYDLTGRAVHVIDTTNNRLVVLCRSQVTPQDTRRVFWTAVQKKQWQQRVDALEETNRDLRKKLDQANRQLQESGHGRELVAQYGAAYDRTVGGVVVEYTEWVEPAGTPFDRDYADEVAQGLHDDGHRDVRRVKRYVTETEVDD